MIKELQFLLKNSENIDSALIVSPENRRYFTEFPSSDGFLLVTRDDAVFITDSRYIEAAENKVTECKTALQKREISQVYDFFKSNGAEKVGIEASRMTVSELAKFENALKDISIDFSGELDNMIDALRMVKSESEIEKIKKAQKIAEGAFDDICGFIKPGVTEKEIALRLEYYMLTHGAEGLSFETIAVSGKNTSMPHGVPTDKKIEVGDFVTMDYGALYDGYHSDMTRTVAVGKVSDEQKKVYNTVLEAQKAGLDFIRPGVSGRDADRVSRDIIENAGYGEYFGHSLGHGVGVEIHEKPNLSPSSEFILKKGNVVTVEPGIYVPGKFGVRIEDFAVITENGAENMTHCPKELIIL